MATTTPTNFKVRFPEFNSVDDVRIELFIEDATATVNANCSNSDLMITYLTAHLLTVGIQSTDGDISTIKGTASESVGDVSVSYATSSGKPENDFYKTIYGQRYLDLRKNCIGRHLIG